MTQQGVLVEFGSIEDYPLGMAEIGMLNASLTVSVNGTDLPINGDAYVQFTFPANDPAILQTFEHTRNRQNDSRDGAIKPQKAPAAHFRTTDALGTHSPSLFRPPQPSRLDDESTAYETDANPIPGHI